jgi:hypothetical protein
LGSGWLLFLRTGFTERATVRAKIASWLRKQSKATYRPSNRSRTGWTVSQLRPRCPVGDDDRPATYGDQSRGFVDPFRQLNSGTKSLRATINAAIIALPRHRILILIVARLSSSLSRYSGRAGGPRRSARASTPVPLQSSGNALPWQGRRSSARHPSRHWRRGRTIPDICPCGLGSGSLRARALWRGRIGERRLAGRVDLSQHKIAHRQLSMISAFDCALSTQIRHATCGQLGDIRNGPGVTCPRDRRGAGCRGLRRSSRRLR